MLIKQNIGLPFCNYNRGGIVYVLQVDKVETGAFNFLVYDISLKYLNN